MKPLRDDSEPTGGARLALLQVAVVIVVACACYLRAWNFEFVNVDDDRLILDAQSELTQSRAITQAFSRPYFQKGARDHSYYRPLVTVTYAIDAQLSGKNASAYHRTNALLHACVAALVLLWLRAGGGPVYAALLGALIFALHPALTEAVAWVPGRPDLLMTGFAVLAWIFYRRSLQRSSIGNRVLHLGAWLLALLSKEAAVVLPVVWVLESRWLVGKNWRRAAEPWMLWGWALVLAIYAGVRAAALSGAPGMAGLGISADLLSTSVNSAGALLSNLGKLLIPVQLSVLATPEDTWIWPGLLGFALLLFVAYRNSSLQQRVVFALLGYAVLMLPNLAASSQLILENRLYLPVVPLLGLVPSVFERFAWKKQHVALVGIVILAGLTASTLSYQDAFKNRGAFARAAVRESPHSSLAHKNLGLTYHAAGKVDQAFEEYRAALALNPAEPMAHSNLGTILGSQRRFVEAEQEFRQELAVNPGYAPAHHNLAALLQATRRGDEAATHWQASLEADPNDVTALRALYAYYSSRSDAEALHYQQLLQAHAAKPHP
jgi:tetratricopeptide (TPR) repeat protein